MRKVGYKGPREVWFIPSSWAKILPENATVWTHLARRFSVAGWLQLADSEINLKFEVCRMKDPALRMACVEGLRNGGFKLTRKAFDMDATYSRFFRSSKSVQDPADEEEVAAAIRGLVGEATQEFPKVEAVLKGVFAEGA